MLHQQILIFDNVLAFETGYRDDIEIPLPKYDIWECPNCKRINLFESETQRL